MAEDSRRADPIRVPITLPVDIYDWLRVSAFRRHISMAELVREAIREYRERHEPQLPLPLGHAEHQA